MSFVNLRYGLAACCAIGFAAVLDCLQLWFGNFHIECLLLLFLFLLVCFLCYTFRFWECFFWEPPLATILGVGRHIFSLHEARGRWFFCWRKNHRRRCELWWTLLRLNLATLSQRDGWILSCADPKKGGKLLQQKVKSGDFLFFDMKSHSKHLKGLLAHHCDHKNPSRKYISDPGGDFSVSLLQFFSGCRWLSWVN